MRFSANLGFLFTDRPLPDAIHAAHAAGFDAVECHFPYDSDPGAVRAALDAGALIAMDCDVHVASHFDQLRYGVATARRGWLTADRCINAWDAGALRDWIRSKRHG